MKVFKFGGASVKDVEHVKHVGKIIESFQGEKILIVISAMGKTTNALEVVAESFYEHRNQDALRLFYDIKKQHLTLAKYLLVLEFNSCIARLSDLFTEVEWLLHDKAVKDYNYYYDQIVSVGELLSTCIISAYLKEIHINNEWLDVRDVIRTNNHFREAAVNWEQSSQSVNSIVTPLFERTNLVITQGFIGSTDECESTTLGREGSDYSAAVFARILDAQELTIWKDVPGVMNADPKSFPEAVILPHLSYAEVIEMAYYGAQVIHPKTIKPLQNKKIPLLVKCFLDTGMPGTLIDQKPCHELPPIIILKPNQVVIKASTLDFSFIEGDSMRKLYKILNKLNIKPNLIQSGAIGLQISVDNIPDKIEQFALSASEHFEVQISNGYELITLRHYDADAKLKYLDGKKTILMQQNELTVQMIYKMTK